MEQTSGSAGVPDRGQSTAPPVNRTSPILSAAINALKHHHYEEAIAQFEEICQTTTDEPTRLKAQMGLVKAYERIGNVQWAIALCQPLRSSSSSQVRQWATQTLAALDLIPATKADLLVAEGAPAEILVESSPEESLVDQAGFAPLEPERVETLTKSPEQEDGTGFVPLDDTSAPPLENDNLREALPQSSGQSDETGFVPLDDPLAAPLEDDNPFDGPLSDAFGVDPVRDAALAQPSEPLGAVAETPLDLFAAPIATPDDETDMQTAELPASAVVLHYPQWRHAPRAAKWASLGQVDHTKLWGAQVITAIATVWLTTIVFRAILGVWNYALSTLVWPFDLRGLRNYSDPFWLVVLGCVILLCATPWLMDWILHREGAKPMPLETLRRSSPEAVALLRRVCGNGQPLPALRLLPIEIPLVMSYGHLPRFARLAMSQGVLNRLSDDEIAALIALELGHLRHWAIALPSTVTLLSQGPYLAYRSIAQWGDGFAASRKNRQSDRVLQTLAIVGSSLAYGLYRLLRVPGLWLSRLRASYGDRAASELTGNPNGLTRALLRLNLMTAEEVERYGQTYPLLESMSLLLPVDGRSAVPLGGLLRRYPTEPLLLWDCVNPHRQWLSLNSPLPTLGDRLKLLGLYARHWRLQPELDLDQLLRTVPRQSPRFDIFWGQQAAPFVGIAIGFALGLLLWGIGAIADRVNWLGLSWMWHDLSLLRASIGLGFSIGMLLRINPFYPDIKRGALKTEQDTTSLFQTPTALPVDGQPIQIQGWLVGRSGLANVLAQDLYLQSSTGLIRLHLISQIGPLGQLFLPFQRFLGWIGNPVTVTGWYRRGLTPWIDVSTLQLQRGSVLQSGHPQFSTLVMAIAALTGIYLILRGI